MGKSKCRAIIHLRSKMERCKIQMYGVLTEHPSTEVGGRTKFRHYQELKEGWLKYRQDRLKSTIQLNPTPEYRRDV